MRFSRKIPQIWDKKIVRKFAWLPTQVNDEIIWLENYYQKLVYRKGGLYYGWDSVRKWNKDEFKQEQEQASREERK